MICRLTLTDFYQGQLLTYLLYLLKTSVIEIFFLPHFHVRTRHQPLDMMSGRAAGVELVF